MKMLTFPIQFYIENISNGFGAINSKEIYLKGNVYEFSVITMLLMNWTY